MTIVRPLYWGALISSVFSPTPRCLARSADGCRGIEQDQKKSFPLGSVGEINTVAKLPDLWADGLCMQSFADTVSELDIRLYYLLKYPDSPTAGAFVMCPAVEGMHSRQPAKRISRLQYRLNLGHMHSSS